MIRAVLVCAIFFINGCILAPLLDGARNMGVRRSDREMLLQKDLKSYHAALYWGDIQGAVGFVSDEAKGNVKDLLIQMKRSEMRIVGSEVEFVELSDDGYTADVSVQVKAYKVPYYVVENITHKEKWSYTSISGWKIADYSTEKERA